jgi:hypothetical protein
MITDRRAPLPILPRDIVVRRKEFACGWRCLLPPCHIPFLVGMDPSQAVQTILDIGKTPFKELNHMSDDLISELVASVRGLLRQMSPLRKSSDQLIPFCQLISFKTIDCLLRCRRGRWSAPDSWLNIILLELVEYCSQLVSRSAYERCSRGGRVQKVLLGLSLDSCAQLPGRGLFV